MRLIIKAYMETILQTAMVYMNHARRETIYLTDVTHSLERNGNKMYYVKNDGKN